MAVRRHAVWKRVETGVDEGEECDDGNEVNTDACTGSYRRTLR